jgi:hypothetical protein
MINNVMTIFWILCNVQGDCRKGVVDVAQGKVVRCRQDGYSMIEILFQRHKVRHMEPRFMQHQTDCSHLHRHLAARRILETQHLLLFDS